MTSPPPLCQTSVFIIVAHLPHWDQNTTPEHEHYDEGGGKRGSNDSNHSHDDELGIVDLFGLVNDALREEGTNEKMCMHKV